MKNQKINEATSDSFSKGSFVPPLQPGFREFDKDVLAPFTDDVSKYNDALLAYDSYDGKMSMSKKKIKKIEDKAKRISDYSKRHPELNDDDGGILNPTFKHKDMNEWVEITKDIIFEDLAVWFGTKKKSKGSSQPKGPWVDICRKVDGKHPPCGRSDAKDRSYPKCRAAGVAGKMSADEKRRACQQKRRAEKTHDKSGTGNKPKMVSHKKKIDEMIIRILNRL